MNFEISGKIICMVLCAGLVWTPALFGSQNLYVLDLDGSGDYVSAVDNDNLTDFSNGSFTIQAWIFLKQLDFNQGIVSKWVDSGDQRSYAFLVTSEGQLRLYLSGDGTYNSSYTWQVNPQVVFSDTWYHVALVVDPTASDKIKFYVDNVEYAHTNSATDPPSSVYNNNSQFHVGNFAGQYLYGYMDEVRLTDGVISSFPDDVWDLPLTADSDTEVLYHFNHESGDVADYATVGGNPNNTGTMQGNATRRAWDGCGPGNDLPLPVTLVSLSANGGDAIVTIYWSTESEIDNLGFHLYRSMNQSSGFTRITSSLIPSQGFTVATQQYEYIDDRDLINGVTYYYKISDVDVNGRERMHQIIASATPLDESFLPGESSTLAAYQLSQNYPNPFNTTTTIRYYVRNGGMVHLGVYNLRGEEVAVLVDEIQETGEFYYEFDASPYPAGIYFIRLSGEKGYDNIKKMLFLK